jgi:hypothetical protein
VPNPCSRCKEPPRIETAPRGWCSLVATKTESRLPQPVENSAEILRIVRASMSRALRASMSRSHVHLCHAGTCIYVTKPGSHYLVQEIQDIQEIRNRRDGDPAPDAGARSRVAVSAPPLPVIPPPRSWVGSRLLGLTSIAIPLQQPKARPSAQLSGHGGDPGSHSPRLGQRARPILALARGPAT